MEALFSTKQRTGKKIGSIFEKFKAKMRYVNCKPQYAAIAFCKGLLLGTALYANLIHNPLKDIDDIVTEIEGEILIEKAKEAKVK